jgi:outer membrane protein assembly factor BamB
LAPSIVPLSVLAQEPSPATTSVHLRWGARPGVTRYRLQVARDRNFTDIVFDRVVAGTEFEVNDLTEGRYYWRLAPLTGTRGEFSSAAVVEVQPPAGKADALLNSKPAPVTASGNNAIVAGGGWRAALGDTSRLALAHLRAVDRFDVVTTNSEGATFALDATNGMALWTSRASSRGSAPAQSANAPLPVRTKAGLDNVLIFSGKQVINLDGQTGRELWRAELSANIFAAAVSTNGTNATIAALDNSRQRLFLINAQDGTSIGEIKLQLRAVRGPVAFDRGDFLIAYDNGLLERRNAFGVLVTSGYAGSPATTAPLPVRAARGDLILIGTRDGLTAMTADGLQPLGRVSIKDDAPRGNLFAADLNGDGAAEVIMTTERRHIIAVNAADGKIIWDVPVSEDVEQLLFADVDKDRVLDILVPATQMLALSGRDGSTIWKDTEPSTFVANHANAPALRSIVGIASGSGTVVISPEAARNGLRAIVFSGASVRPVSQ